MLIHKAPQPMQRELWRCRADQCNEQTYRRQGSKGRAPKISTRLAFTPRVHVASSPHSWHCTLGNCHQPPLAAAKPSVGDRLIEVPFIHPITEPLSSLYHSFPPSALQISHRFVWVVIPSAVPLAGRAGGQGLKLWARHLKLRTAFLFVNVIIIF